MADIIKLRANLEACGFATSYFDTAAQAADYLDGQIDGTTVGFGGPMTVKAMGLDARLASHHETHCPWGTALADREAALQTQLYHCSATGVA